MYDGGDDIGDGDGGRSVADTLSTAVYAVSVVSAVLIDIAVHIMILHKQQLIESLLMMQLHQLVMVLVLMMHRY